MIHKTTETVFHFLYFNIVSWVLSCDHTWCGRVEGRRGRRGQTSPGEERGNETGKVAIAHGSVEFCEATPIGLADES